MRIVGGKSGGRILKAPKGLDVRPTPDLVKQAVFNSLGARVEGAEVLELFGGSGALSLEALSRAARTAVIVEKSNRTARMIRANFESLGLAAGQLELRVQDAFTALAQLAHSSKRFDLLFADPPYGEKNLGKRSESFAQKLLDDPNLPKLLKAQGLLILGHSKRDTLDIPPDWVERKQLKHGDSMMRFLEARLPW
ncbi:MAG TPA: 16S rRNA (guanine(966)-N(2))-methyltransferase RsmD [Verrucomicrobiae bacterium]|jgi:16S rRNA (guanine(966)-N(2))-methyltransferase RsmD|nr:16S rRNA (guanine(966)-N(2))-methyltransferase RsmD [Verrucomicrobiae bacterium]